MSFKAGAETSKLLVTLATAVIAFCVTFINVELALTHVLSTGSLGKPESAMKSTNHAKSDSAAKSDTPALPDSPSHSVTIWNKAIQFPYMMQVIAFVLGMALLVTYGAWRLFH